MEFFEIRIFLQNRQKMYFFFLPIYSFAIDFPVCAPVSSSQWSQSDARRLKTVGGVGFWVLENVTFQESSCKIEKWMNRRNQYIKKK